MANMGSRFRKALVRYIHTWGEEIEVLEEKPVGYRFVGNPRFLDIILGYGGKYMGIEAKIQEGSGTAYQKLSYTLEDCKSCPIPTIIVFSGAGIKDDMKAKLVSSGYGIEVSFEADEHNEENDKITDPKHLLRQRVYIELGLDWFPLFIQ